MKRKLNKTFMSVAVGLLVSGMSVIATASDTKTFPGSICVEMETTSEQIIYTAGAAENNDSTNSRWFNCPIVLDNTWAYADVNVSLYVKDYHASKNLECELYRGKPDSIIEKVAEANNTGTGYKTIDFGTTDMGIGADGFLSVSCQVPDKESSRSGILNIIVEEQ